jgi:crotonobetainyl-CoA:carnitine CoA-transferase CaiB-like acyl-CoA transferase
MEPLLAERSLTGARRSQRGNTAFYAAPSDVYKTSDGWIIVPTVGHQMFRRWARAVGREDLTCDPRCKDDITRADNAEMINEVMSAWCASRTRDEAIAELERARVPCAPVYDLDEALADPQVRARNLLEEVGYPGSPAPVPVASPPARLSETPARIRRRAPGTGEHNDEVLIELGYSVDEIAAFRGQGVI